MTIPASAAPGLPANRISCMSANFVARQLGYQMSGGWEVGDAATNDWFAPVDTYEERFAALVAEIREMGFAAMDLWLAHLNPAWATAAHVERARAVLQREAMTVTSLAGWFGASREEFEACCRLAHALGAQVLGGRTTLLHSDRAWVLATLAAHGLTYGLENHPERTPAELVAELGPATEDADEWRIGLCVDTGWFGTHGYDAATALEQLAPLLRHVHLKDVLAAGGHETCRFGLGVVPIERCLAALHSVGYAGGISIEHEPERFDPRPDLRECLDIVRGWSA